MDTNLNSLAELVRREAARVQGFLDLAALLEKAGSLEQAVNDRQRLHDQAKEQHEAMLHQVADAQAELEALQGKLEAARSSATKTGDDARSEAEKIVQGAKDRAAEMIKAARAEVVKVREDAQAEAKRIVAGAMDQLKELRTAIAQGETARAQVKTDIAAATKELAELNTKIERAKAAARKTFEGA